VEDMRSLLSGFLELARLTAVWPGWQSFPWNKCVAVCLHSLGGDFVGAVSSRTQFTVPNLLCSSLRLASLSYFPLVLAASRKNTLFLFLPPRD